MFWRFFRLGESSVGSRVPQADLPRLVIVPLRSMMSSIIEGQMNSNEFDLEVKGFPFSQDVLE